MRKGIKILGKVFSVAVLLLIILPMVLSLLLDIPAVQNYVVQKAVRIVSKTLETTVSIDRVDIGLFSKVKVKGFYVEDYQRDTLLYVGKIDAYITGLGIFGGGVVFSRGEISGAKLYLRETPEGEMNIKQIVNRISDPDKPRKGNFRLSLRKASIEGMDLCLERLTRRDPEFGIDFGHMHLYGITAHVSDFTIDGQSIYTTIEAMSARERSGFVLDRFSGRFYLTNGALGFEDTSVVTPRSNVDIPYISLVGDSWAGYKDFLGEHKGAERGQQQIVFVDGLKGLRMGVKDADKDFMIFDTLNDPQESKDLASSKPELQARMKAAALSNRRASLPSKTVFDTALVPAVETKGAASPGLKWSLYEGEFPWVPDFRQLKKQAAAHGVAPSPSVKMNGPRKRGVELTGYVKVPADGEYTFYLSTDANKGSKAFVRLHGMELIDADKTYEPGSEVSSDLGDRKNPVYLKAGLHPIRIGYVGNAGPASKLVLKWQGPGLSKQEIPASAFSHDGGAE
mgnify:CR=1 FL=1